MSVEIGKNFFFKMELIKKYNTYNTDTIHPMWPETPAADVYHNG